jgi:hypothetical protein
MSQLIKSKMDNKINSLEILTIYLIGKVKIMIFLLIKHYVLYGVMEVQLHHS